MRLIKWEMKNSPFLETGVHSYLYVPWYLMGKVPLKIQISGYIWARVWACVEVQRHGSRALWAFKLCVVGGDVPTLSSVVLACNLMFSITKPDLSKSAYCYADFAAAGVWFFRWRHKIFPASVSENKAELLWLINKSFNKRVLRWLICWFQFFKCLYLMHLFVHMIEQLNVRNGSFWKFFTWLPISAFLVMLTIPVD